MIYWKERFLRALWWLGTATVLFWLLVGSVAYWVKHKWLPADTSGWAQAIGSFIAVGVAIAIPYFQGLRQSMEKKEELRSARLDSYNATRALVEHIQKLFVRVVELDALDFVLNRGDSSLPHELRQAAAMIREFPVTALSTEMVHYLIGLREEAAFGEHIAKTMKGGSVMMPPSFERSRRSAKLSVQRLEAWINEIDELEDRLRNAD